MKNLRYLALFFLVGCLMPVAIWVAAASALYHNAKHPRLARKAAVAPA